MFPLSGARWILSLVIMLRGAVNGKWVEGHIDTKENWAFLARFCFLSFEGQFEYLVEFDRDIGTPNLLLYYDDDDQWPAVYHSSKSCKEREAVLNKNGQNQIVQLSHWYPDTEYSGCIVTKANRELPAVKSTTTGPKTTTTTTKPTAFTTTKSKNNTNSTLEHPRDPAYYDQFIKTTPRSPKTTVDSNATVWYELVPTDAGNLNLTTTVLPEDELWESVGTEKNDSHLANLKDVEILFDDVKHSGRKIKRSTSELLARVQRRRVQAAPQRPAQGSATPRGGTERLVVSCHNTRRFRSARERWWFIAISSCDSTKGLNVRYKFLMTNGADGDFWHFHFSADEFYVLPVLVAYTFAYVALLVAVVVCSVELRSRHLLHATYKLYVGSVAAQHAGVLVQTLAYVRYATSGVLGDAARICGQFLCGVSEMSFLLLLVLLAKGYTVTRGRLKVGFTVRLTVFMCAYTLTYIVLFVYQAKAFDPGEVLYLYESPAGHGLVALRVLAWLVFAYATFFTVKKYPQKNSFYCPFFICGTLWFYAGPLFILTANSCIDKWVRESVVAAVLLFIAFTGHIMFLLLTLPVFANKNFPYHIRTTQIGVMEVTGSAAIDGFGHNAYQPSNGAAQTVIIPLTRRTEELIGNMYTQYMATAPPLSIENEAPRQNGVAKRTDSLSPKNTLTHQESTETNKSEDIKPYLPKEDNEIFTVQNQISKMEQSKLPVENGSAVLPDTAANEAIVENNGGVILGEASRSELPSVLRSRRNILEPIKRDAVPSWSLAKGPCVVGMTKKVDAEAAGNGVNHLNQPPLSLPEATGRKVPPVRHGLQPSTGEMSTIREGHVQSYKNLVSQATIDLFTVGHDKG